MGYSQAVSEKALFMVQGKGVAGALDWIDQHCNDADFEEALMIVGQDSSAGPAKPMSNLTKEEKLLKVKELQESIRKKRAIEDEKNTRENEAARRIADQEMAKAKRINEEREYENQIA